MNIIIYDVFVLNRVLHLLLQQQTSYKIQTAFKIHNLIRWLDETETFIMNRMSLIFGDETFSSTMSDEQIAFMNTEIPFVGTTLTIDELLETEGNVRIDINDIGILEKILSKTESE